MSETRKIIPNLTPGIWAFRFRARNEDGLYGAWSAVFQYQVVADNVPPPVPSAPEVTAILGGASVKWIDPSYQIPIDFNRVNVYVSINNGPYSLVDTIASEGASAIYTSQSGVVLRFKLAAVDNSGNISAFSEASDPVSPIESFDDTPPSNTVSGLTAVASIDPNGKYQFAGRIRLTWVPDLTDTSIRGYRIRYRVGTDPYTYADIPGASTSTAELNGLLIGATYDIGIAPYDQLNNVATSYQNYPATTITGNASLSQGAIIEAGDMQIGYGVKNENGTQSGTNKGIWLDPFDYWLIKSDQSSAFRVGGASSFMIWNGTDLTVSGTINARGGSISGNLVVDSGGAIRVTGTAGRVEVSSAGIVGFNATTGGTPQVTIAANTGQITAVGGRIGGWNLTDNTLSSQNGFLTFRGDATGTQNLISTSNSSFMVNAAGAVTISGTITAQQGAIGSWNISGSRLVSQTNSVELDGSDGSIRGSLISGGSVIGAQILSSNNASAYRVRINPSNTFGASIDFEKSGTTFGSISSSDNIVGTSLEISSNSSISGFGPALVRVSGGNDSTVSMVASNSINIETPTLTLGRSGITLIAASIFNSSNGFRYENATLIGTGLNAGGMFRNIWISTAIPSSGDGKVGDVWLQYD